MATLTISHTETFVTIECSSCGCTFALTDGFVGALKRSHETFYCPNGHACHWPGKSDVEKLRDEKLLLQQRLDQANAHAKTWERQAIAAKGQTTKLRKRISAGVCPCCHRTFKQLAAHMTHKHPEYSAKEPHDQCVP